VLHPGPPVITSRISDTQSFAFVEIRTPEETDLCLSLGELPFLGTRLKIGRPKGFIQQYGNMSSIAAVRGQIGYVWMPGDLFLHPLLLSSHCAVQAAMGTSAAPAMAGGGAMSSGLGLGGFGSMAGLGLAGMGGFSGIPGLGLQIGGGAGSMPGTAGGLTAMGLNSAAGLLGAATAHAAAAAAAASLGNDAQRGGRETVAGVPDDDTTPTDVILVANLAPFINDAALKEVSTGLNRRCDLGMSMFHTALILPCRSCRLSEP
jgi:hypothetical protein